MSTYECLKYRSNNALKFPPVVTEVLEDELNRKMTVRGNTYDIFNYFKKFKNKYKGEAIEIKLFAEQLQTQNYLIKFTEFKRFHLVDINNYFPVKGFGQKYFYIRDYSSSGASFLWDIDPRNLIGSEFFELHAKTIDWNSIWK